MTIDKTALLPEGLERLAEFGIDAVDLDMIQRGDFLGPKLGAQIFAALTTWNARPAAGEPVAVRPWDTRPTGDDAMEPSEIDVHEGAWAVVIGTNAKPAGWIDTHELFAHQLYRHHILASPPSAQGEPMEGKRGVAEGLMTDTGLTPDDQAGTEGEIVFRLNSEVDKLKHAVRERADVSIRLTKRLLPLETRAAEVAEVLRKLLATLRREAPGTALNNHKFDLLGIRANAALRAIDDVLCSERYPASDELQAVEETEKAEENVIRLSDKDRQLLRMITPFVDQRSREPGDAWNEAAAILWLIIDEASPIAIPTTAEASDLMDRITRKVGIDLGGNPLSPAPSLAVSDEATKLISQIEERFPNWRSYRDLIDCIDATLGATRNG